MRYYDSHLHNVANERGGFIVGLEGTPWFDGTLHNEEALDIATKRKEYKFFYYVTASALFDACHIYECRKFVKYHPRRERYSPDDVLKSIQVLDPEVVMIDTLNEPYWTAYDYWRISRAFPEKKFVFPHAGGYLINDFIKLCHFQSNVWIDFSLTHTKFGLISPNPLPYVDEAIKYSLASSFKARVLMGSDYPFFSQDDVASYYTRLGKIDLLNANFEALSASI